MYTSLTFNAIIVLHPCYNLRYFKDYHWEDAWISTAKQLVYDTFSNSYAGRYAPEPSDNGDEDAEGSKNRNQAKVSRVLRYDNNIEY